MKPIVSRNLCGLLLVLLESALGSRFWGPSFFPPRRFPSAPDLDNSVRGGGQSDGEERYSRQVYTLGARAHGIFRSSTTIVMDGSATSGLLYETAKNLALLGVARIILIQNPSERDEFDDLGNAYQRNARAEVEATGENDNQSSYELLQHYLYRLNPQIHVSTTSRSELSVATDQVVYLAVDKAPENPNDDWPLIVVETAGLFGRVQCDLGDEFTVHDADGEQPISIPLDSLECAENEEILVRCVAGEKHDVSVGDAIEFQLRNGSIVALQSKVTSIETPERFRMKLVEGANPSELCRDMNSQAAIVRRRKLPQQIAFKRLSEIDINDDLAFAPCDLSKSFDSVRRQASMECFEAMRRFREEQGVPPSLQDSQKFNELLSKTVLDSGSLHVKNFLRGCAAKFAPLQAMFGAIAAQEALKAATGLYTPITQVLLYDCDELYHDETVADENPDIEASAPGLRYILGDATVSRLQNMKVFVVGAGAIGCELLKDLAPMGVKNIVVTDMDTIEPSNLSRQLLFRDSDVGKFKSLAAKEAVLRMNPDINIEVHSSKVGPGDDNPFDEDFWSKEVDIVLNALDNVEARMFIDSQCVASYKPLVDAGTMGAKGNVQVVVPGESESYASSADPPEQAIPVCTLKNFPYAISHTIQWGRDLFDGLYRRRPNQTNDMATKLKKAASTRRRATRLINEKGIDRALETVKELVEDFLSIRDTLEPRVRSEALLWAARLAHENFYEASRLLLKQHPLDSTDDENEPFWSGTRRAPKLLKFNGSPETEEEKSVDDNLIQFVIHAASIRIETVLTKMPNPRISEQEAQSALEACQPYPTTKIEAPEKKVQECLSTCAEMEVSGSMKEIEFEKDDDTHASFCTAASNLRAIAYGIPPVDMAETRRIAGRIIPAMITTTALVSGLSCIEFIKLAQHDHPSAKKYRNSFHNLALNFYAFTAPLPAPERPGFRGRVYNLWDNWELQESRKAASRGGVRMKSLRRRLQKLAHPEDPDAVEVLSISLGPYMVYSNYIHDDDEDYMNSSLWDQLVEATTDEDEDDDRREESSDVDINGSYIDLDVLVEDVEGGDAVELPRVRVKRCDKR